MDRQEGYQVKADALLSFRPAARTVLARHQWPGMAMVTRRTSPAVGEAALPLPQAAMLRDLGFFQPGAGPVPPELPAPPPLPGKGEDTLVVPEPCGTDAAAGSPDPFGDMS